MLTILAYTILPNVSPIGSFLVKLVRGVGQSPPPDLPLNESVMKSFILHLCVMLPPNLVVSTSTVHRNICVFSVIQLFTTLVFLEIYLFFKVESSFFHNIPGCVQVVWL